MKSNMPLQMWNLDGVTTNPRHVQVSGKSFLRVIREIGELFIGTDKTVSVEVNPHHTEFEAMVAEGQKLAAMSPNFVIKLPAEASFKAMMSCKKRGVRTNLTLVFSAAQALQAMRMGAFYVSPFIGWKESNGEEVQSFIQDIVAIRDNYGFNAPKSWLRLCVMDVRLWMQLSPARIL